MFIVTNEEIEIYAPDDGSNRGLGTIKRLNLGIPDGYKVVKSEPSTVISLYFPVKKEIRRVKDPNQTDDVLEEFISGAGLLFTGTVHSMGDNKYPICNVRTEYIYIIMNDSIIIKSNNNTTCLRISFLIMGETGDYPALCYEIMDETDSIRTGHLIDDIGKNDGIVYCMGSGIDNINAHEEMEEHSYLLRKGDTNISCKFCNKGKFLHLDQSKLTLKLRNQDIEFDLNNSLFVYCIIDNRLLYFYIKNINTLQAKMYNSKNKTVVDITCNSNIIYFKPVVKY